MTREYRLFGDSHCNAIMGGKLALQAAGKPVPVRLAGVNMLGAATVFYGDFHVRRGNDIFLTHHLFKGRMAGLCDDHGRMLAPAGDFLVSLGLHTQTMLAGRLFLNHAPAFASPRPARAFMSEGALSAVVLRYHSRTLDFLRDLQDLGARITIVSAPPPTRRFKILGTGYAEEDVAALDRFLRGVMVQRLDAMGIPVIPPPPQVSDEAGFMLPPYQIADENDPHHGNRDYGALMIGQIAAFLTQREPHLQPADG
ncbi:hypothetical protein [Paracoccus luteus]|uniref:hypothetical protein n=1 Tax=Paracoccus luteus TaxID=2508543 RepID=UPI00107057DA|nr:hypothetical protein [Paracoccus luteus]